ncbi:MAG TPA: hypothetical protein VLE89_03200 [Chlamydiales bacterium]|nr:hypothetical protein [Chlamydiales bacterium]
MKITATLLSIPPYLSTTWKNISSLHVREEKDSYTLVVLLQNRTEVEVPHLAKPTVDQIFEAHAQYAETESPKNPLDTPISFSLPLDKNGGGMLDSVTTSMQHNPEQADLPLMSPDVLKKITTIAQAFGIDDPAVLPKAEPHCNCVYCQVARALHGEESLPELEVSEEDLKFRSWEVEQTADKLYIVTNPLDANEHYSVFLGEPLGCTCGAKNCEHIRAVLNT